MALLGSLIIEPGVIDDVMEFVISGDAFYSEAHALLFETIRELHNRTQSGDLVQLTEALKGKKSLDDIGGLDYLVRLAEQTPSAANAVHYARIVRDKYQLRRLIEAAGEILFDAYHTGDGGEDERIHCMDRAEQRIFEIAESAAATSQATLAELLQLTMDMLEANKGKTITGLNTGFYDLNEYTSGLQEGELVIVAARPSMGKTALALNLAEHVSRRGMYYDGSAGDTKVPVGFFSMEMSSQSLAQRLLCSISKVDSQAFRRGRIDNETRDYLAKVQIPNLSKDMPLYVDDTPGLTVMQLRAKARRMVHRHAVKCIFVDYLQLMSSPGSSRDGRQNEVSAISRGIKALARELNIPVVCLAQLNRGAEQREGHRPRMADLRESGSIEQDADTIILLHREEYYHVGDHDWLNENPEKVGVAELIIAKQRNGPTGTVRLKWQPEFTRFDNLEQVRGNFDPEIHDSQSRSHKPSPVNLNHARFSPGAKTGPIADHRDGGGPDRNAWDDPTEDDLPPF